MKIRSPREINDIEIRENLLNSPLFYDIAPDLQQRLLTMGTLYQWQRDDYLFMDGDLVESVYYLISGKMKEYYFDDCGDEFLRHIFVPGCYISLHVVVGRQQIYSYSCAAVQKSLCFVLPSKSFYNLLKQQSTLVLKVAALLSRDYENSCRKKCLCKKARAVSKVAGYLLSQLQLMDCHSGFCQIKSGKDQVDLRPMGLAARDVCLVRETFSRALLTLQKQNIVRSRRGVVDILDQNALKHICGMDGIK